MSIEVKLPELGDGIDSGDVLQVLVQVGDEIAKDQGIIEMETDKATVEVPSSHAGRVTAVHVSEGDSIPIGGLLVTLEAVDAGGSAAAPAAPAAADPTPPAPAEPASPPPTPPAATPSVAAEPAPQIAPPTPPAPAPAAASSPATPAPPSPPTTNSESATPEELATIPAGPAVRRFAREVGVDLRRVTGSGPGGRIQREDVLAAVRQAAGSARAGAAAAEAGKDTERDDWGPIRVERMSKIRRTIAKRMHESWSNIPRVTNFDDADVTDLEKIRQGSKADYANQGIKLTSMPFVIKSVAMALRSNPDINATVDMEQGQIIYKDYINIGIAVDTERGLVVPSLRNADEMSIPDIARALADIAKAARENTFSLDDLRGGTFTISNLGAIGGSYSTPIINLPEVAILLVGRTRELPVVHEGQIVPRLIMPLSLSYDHRLVDGATAARFLNDVIGYLKAPSRLLLAP